jgi:hypothetical protein
MLSAMERKYLLKVSAMSCWLLIILPSVFKDSIVVILAFQGVPKVTILHVILILLIVIGLS